MNLTLKMLLTLNELINLHPFTKLSADTLVRSLTIQDLHNLFPVINISNFKGDGHTYLYVLTELSKRIDKYKNMDVQLFD